MENQLQVIVAESGLEKTKAQFLLDNFKDYFEIASEWEKKAKSIVVTDVSQTVDMEMAKVGRKFLSGKRISIEKARVELKQQSLREGKAIDGIANVLKALIIPIEEHLKKQEKFVEIQEEKKREAVRIEIEERIEKERVEAERLEKLEIERHNQAVQYIDFWTTEKYAFREMSQTNFESIMSDLKKAKEKYNEEQEKVRIDNEKLKKEAEVKERKAKEEKEQHEKQLAEERAKAQAEQDKIRKEAEVKERKAKEEKEQHEKQLAEEKAKNEEQMKKIKEDAELNEKERLEELRKEREEAKKDREAADVRAKEAQEKALKEAEEKNRLEELLKNQVECPKCNHKFQLNNK